MAIVRMDWSRSPEDWGFYRYTDTFNLASDELVFVSSITMLSAAIHPSFGHTAYIEYTLSSPSLVEAGTALWIKWPAGDVTVSSGDALMSCVTAIRGKCTGTATIEVVAT